MRTCPKCGRVYGDDLNFCLEDGTLLARGDDDPDRTEVFVVPPSVPTVDVPRPTEASPAILDEIPMPTIADVRPRIETTSEDDDPGSRRLFFLNGAVKAVLIILSLGFICVILYETIDLSGAATIARVDSNRKPAANTMRTASSTPSPTPSATPTPIRTPTPTLTPTPNKPVEIDNPQVPQSDPFPTAGPPDLTGHYYARRPDADTVLLQFDVANQDRGDFQIRDAPDKLRGSASIHHTDENTFIGYIDWYLADGSADEEEIYICGNFDALCGKLPFDNDYFIATKVP